MSTRRSAVITLWSALGCLVILGLLAFLLGWVAQWATPLGKDRAASVNATRQTFLAASAGLVAIVGLITGARTFVLSREGQLTDRYAKAVVLLASDKPTERFGGIFALERLMRESARDHDTICELLTAFVRHNAPAVHKNEKVDRHAVQAALTVIGRRPRRNEKDDLNLARTDLRRMSLVAGNFSQGDFRECLMDGANLSLANCRGARFTGASLDRSIVIDTDFTEADLTGVDLSTAIRESDMASTQSVPAQRESTNPMS